MGTENDNCVTLIRLARSRVRASGLQFAYPACLPDMDKGAATSLILGCCACDKVYTGILQLPAPPSMKPSPFQSNLVVCVFDVPDDLTAPAKLCWDSYTSGVNNCSYAVDFDNRAVIVVGLKPHLHFPSADQLARQTITGAAQLLMISPTALVRLANVQVDPETVAQTLMHDFINKYLLGENHEKYHV